MLGATKEMKKQFCSVYFNVLLKVGNFELFSYNLYLLNIGMGIFGVILHCP